MKAAGISEIKHELTHLDKKVLLEICLRVIKYKKENKELVTFLLFEANDLQSYISNVKADMDEQFEQINKANLYFAKKSLRKILKTTNKYIKHTASKEVELGLLIYYCNKIISSGIKILKSTALTNIYNNQLKKIKLIMSGLHPDLQYDYASEVEMLKENS